MGCIFIGILDKLTFKEMIKERNTKVKYAKHTENKEPEKSEFPTAGETQAEVSAFVGHRMLHSAFGDRIVTKIFWEHSFYKISRYTQNR